MVDIFKIMMSLRIKQEDNLNDLFIYYQLIKIYLFNTDHFGGALRVVI